jgi:phosphoesterase RecJ-like protein
MASVREAKDALLAARRAVLTTHLNADGDGAGSEAALAAWLRTNGAEVAIVNPTPFPQLYRFLLGDEDLVIDVGSPAAVDFCTACDVAVVLDTGATPRIGRVRPLIRELPAVVIDHHQPGEEPLGGISLRDPEACATGELVHDVILAANGPWNLSIARALYVAVLTDTGSFRFSNSSPRSHQLAADLIEMGVEPEATHEQVYGGAPLRRYRLLEKALATLEVDDEAGVAWMSIPRDAYDALGVSGDDLEGMVDVPRSVEGAEVGLLFRQTATGDIKVSFRSSGPTDVNELARRFGGGGHTRASGAMVSGPLERAVADVVQATKSAVAKCRDGQGSA